MELSVLPAQVEFEAQGDIYLPDGKETNVFRGALGTALRKVCCEPGCPGARSCPAASTCVYSRFFEPRWEAGPSGYREAPRPFVLRWKGPTGCVRRGDRFRAEICLFDVGVSMRESLNRALELAGADGLGASRASAKLIELNMDSDVLRLAVKGEHRCGTLRLHFVTPIELKSGGEILSDPDFGILTHRLLERVWALGSLYQNWPAHWDYSDLLDLGRTVRLVSSDWRRREIVRRSSRTRQHHSIGGFTGWAEYDGPVGAFVPLLEIARWTGIGRQTVWGKGEVRVDSVTWTD